MLLCAFHISLHPAAQMSKIRLGTADTISKVKEFLVIKQGNIHFYLKLDPDLQSLTVRRSDAHANKFAIAFDDASVYYSTKKDTGAWTPLKPVWKEEFIGHAGIRPSDITSLEWTSENTLSFVADNGRIRDAKTFHIAG